MKKKLLTLLGTFSTLFGVIPTLTACGGTGEQIDKTKTIIFVNNFCRGFGGEWLTAYKKEFEALHAEDVYEEGKKGVQIFISNARGPAIDMIDSILDGRDEVFFTEQTDYFVLKDHNVLRDITDAITEKIPGENTSIEDKMSAGQIEYLKTEDGKYFALPHYSGYFGFNYDVDLFDKKCYYFNADRTGFINFLDEPKSVGPDGKAGTFDDGLPITYDEFYQLCEQMVADRITPITINGNTGGYLNLLINNLIINDLGLEQANLIYSCDGLLKDLISIDANGKITKLPDTTITPETGYKVYSQRARYEAFKFYETLHKATPATTTQAAKKSYLLDKVDSTAYTANLAQLDFLQSGIAGAVDPDFQRIAMIGEGSWWSNETKGIFEELSQIYGEQYSISNRRMALMPFPRSVERADGEDKTNVLFDHLAALSFVKRNVADWKYPLIKEFVQFCNSDKALVQFSEITNTTKALKYVIPESSLQKMNSYGRSLYNLQSNSVIVYPYNSTNHYRNNATFYKYEAQAWTILNGLNEQFIINGFKKNSTTGESYFRGHVDYYTKAWKDGVITITK